MMGFIHSFERSLLNIGFSTLGGPRSAAPRTRIVRETSRRSMHKVIAALAATRAERDVLKLENDRLRRELRIARLLGQR